MALVFAAMGREIGPALTAAFSGFSQSRSQTQTHPKTLVSGGLSIRGAPLNLYAPPANLHAGHQIHRVLQGFFFFVKHMIRAGGLKKVRLGGKSTAP